MHHKRDCQCACSSGINFTSIMVVFVLFLSVFINQFVPVMSEMGD
jgi:hypothetical protein